MAGPFSPNSPADRMPLALKFRQPTDGHGACPQSPNRGCPPSRFSSHSKLGAMRLWRHLWPDSPLLRKFLGVLTVFIFALALTWALVMGVLFPLSGEFAESVYLASSVFTCVATLAVAVGFYLTALVEEKRRLIEGTGAMLSILNTFTTSEMYNSHSPFRGRHQVYG
jgi:hypothetical protein